MQRGERRRCSRPRIRSHRSGWHIAEKATLDDQINSLIAGQEELVSKLEAAEAALSSVTSADETRSATEEKLRADVAALKKVDHPRKQREAHLADDSARTVKYRAAPRGSRPSHLGQRRARSCGRHRREGRRRRSA